MSHWVARECGRQVSKHQIKTHRRFKCPVQGALGKVLATPLPADPMPEVPPAPVFIAGWHPERVLLLTCALAGCHNLLVRTPVENTRRFCAPEHQEAARYAASRARVLAGKARAPTEEERHSQEMAAKRAKEEAIRLEAERLGREQQANRERQHALTLELLGVAA